MPRLPGQRARDAPRRPIEAAEIPHLEALGARLAAVRRDRGLAQDTLAEAAELSTSGIRRIEAGTRRTRRSTLDRIAAALGDPDLGDELAGLAGPALAPESLYGERGSANSATFSASLVSSRGSPPPTGVGVANGGCHSTGCRRHDRSPPRAPVRAV
jgi:transcriptional regulator with XRE-family HTH domain